MQRTPCTGVPCSRREKGRARTGSRHNSGHSTTMASSRDSRTTGNQDTQKVRAKAQTTLIQKGSVSIIGPDGLFYFPQLGSCPSTARQHDDWNAIDLDNYGEGNWEGRLARLCKTRNIENIELASHFTEAAEQFHLVKRRKKVSSKCLTSQMNSTKV